MHFASRDQSSMACGIEVPWAVAAAAFAFLDQVYIHYIHEPIHTALGSICPHHAASSAWKGLPFLGCAALARESTKLYGLSGV